MWGGDLNKQVADCWPSSVRADIKESTMRIMIMLVIATFAVAASPWTSAQATNIPAWCGSSGYENGPPRERGPGTGPFWAGEPTDCESIWRHGHYRGTDPDPNIRLQLMRGR